MVEYAIVKKTPPHTPQKPKSAKLWRSIWSSRDEASIWTICTSVFVSPRSHQTQHQAKPMLRRMGGIILLIVNTQPAQEQA